MLIPKLHYIAEGSAPKELLDNIQKACTSGAELVQLRYKNVSEKKFLKLATAAQKITAHFQTRLILSEHYKIAKAIKADGVHLETTDADPTLVRKHLFPWQMIGATANNVQECEALLTKEVDYISLGPFKGVSSNDSVVLGVHGYTAITEALETETPILGFGGITTADVPALLEAGISGIAVSDEITQNFDAIRTYNQLLKASSTQEQRHSFE